MRFKKSGNFAAGMVSRSLPEVSKEVFTFSKITNGVVGDYGEFFPIQDDDTAGGERFRSNFPDDTKVKTFKVSFDGVACVLTVPVGPTLLYQHTLEELAGIPASVNKLFVASGTLVDPGVVAGTGPLLSSGAGAGKFNFQIETVDGVPFTQYVYVLGTPLAMALYSYDNRIAGGGSGSAAAYQYANFFEALYYGTSPLHDMLDVSEVTYLTDNSYLLLNKGLPPLILSGYASTISGVLEIVVSPAHVSSIPRLKAPGLDTEYYSAKSYPYLPLNVLDSARVDTAYPTWVDALGAGANNNADGVIHPIMNFNNPSLFKSFCLKTLVLSGTVVDGYSGLEGAFVKIRNNVASDNVYYLLAQVDGGGTASASYMALIVVGGYTNITSNKNFAISEWNAKYGFPHTGAINNTLGGRLMLAGSKAFQKSIWMAALYGGANQEDITNKFVFMQADMLLAQDNTNQTSGLMHYGKTIKNTKGLVAALGSSSYGAITKIFERRKLHIFTEEGTYVGDYNNAIGSEADETDFLASSQPQTAYRTLKYMAFTPFNSGVLYADTNDRLHYLSTADKDYESVDTIISYQYDFADGIGEIEVIADNLALIKSRYDFLGYKYHFMKLSPKGASAFTLLDTGDVENIVGHCVLTNELALIIHMFHDTRTVSVYVPNNITGYENKRLTIYALPKVELHPIVVPTRLGDSFGSPMKIDKVFFDLVDSTNGVSISNGASDSLYRENNQYHTGSSARYLDGDYGDCSTSYGVTPKFIFGYDTIGVAVNAIGFAGNVEEEN